MRRLSENGDCLPSSGEKGRSPGGRLVVGNVKSHFSSGGGKPGSSSGSWLRLTLGGDRAGGDRVDEPAPVTAPFVTADGNASGRSGNDPGGGGRGTFFAGGSITWFTP